MRYSSHLYLRTDGSLGRFPIIEVDDKGMIVSVCECGDTLHEMASTRFFSGIIIPQVTPFQFSSKDEFLSRCYSLSTDPESHIFVGSSPRLMLVSSFDLNSFDGKSAVFSLL